MSKVAFVALVGLLACGNHEATEQKAAAPAASEADETCKRGAAEVGKALQVLIEQGPTLQPQRMTLVTRDDLPPTKVAQLPIVLVLPTGLNYRGSPIADGAELLTFLQASHAKAAADLAEGRGPDVPVDPDGIYLEIDAAVPWRRVAETTTAAQTAGFRHVTLLFARTAPPTPARPTSAIDADLAKALAAPDRYYQLAELTRKVATPCPALIRVFGRSTRMPEFVAAIEPALVECKCAADLPSLRAVLVESNLDRWPTSALPLVLDATGAPATFPATAPWSEVGPKLVASSQPVSFQVRKQ